MSVPVTLLPTDVSTFPIVAFFNYFQNNRSCNQYELNTSTNLNISIFSFSFAAVRHDRMRGGRNKFGPMYKRDRARKLQVIRQRQVLTSHSGLGGSQHGSNVTLYGGSNGSNSSPMYTSPLHIKQEIQIPQVRNLIRYHKC